MSFVFAAKAFALMPANAVRYRDGGPAADEAGARRLFSFSILYLFVLFAGLLVEHGLWVIF